MVLESVMICLDNSEWMRNGDYAPTRLEAQQDAAGMICNDRTGSNPENTVGVLTMAGRGVDLLVSPTEDAGKILACFTRVTTGGKSDFSSSVQIAQLALKHRKNKNGSQRIIVFVGSPLLEETAALQKIGKQLKKNNVAVDVISFGELSENSDKLTEFINCTNSNDNWYVLCVLFLPSCRNVKDQQNTDLIRYYQVLLKKSFLFSFSVIVFTYYLSLKYHCLSVYLFHSLYSNFSPYFHPTLLTEFNSTPEESVILELLPLHIIIHYIY